MSAVERHIGVTAQPEFLVAIGTDEYALSRAEAVRLRLALSEALGVRGEPVAIGYPEWCAAVSKAFKDSGEDVTVARLRLFNIMQNNGWIRDERHVRRAGDC